MTTSSVDSLFRNTEPAVSAIYTKLLKGLQTIGKITIEPKKTSIHIKSGSAFLGVHPKKKWMDLNIVTDTPLRSPRTKKAEQVSKNRYHNLVRLTETTEVDKELMDWLKKSYKLVLN